MMEFHESARSTLGVEWELQLIDADSQDLRQSADTVIKQVRALPVDTSMIHREMMLNTIELVSRPRSRVSECMADLQAGIDLLNPIVDPLRISLASAGSHPFANPIYQRVTDLDRYAKLVERTQYWGRQMLLFGTHVHVGVESRSKVMPLLRAMLTVFAPIQALTAASPYWSGVRTGYVDNRAMMFQQLPTAGVPHQFDCWEELEHFTDDLLKTGVISHFNEVRWDVRPSPGYGTLEMRMCDAASNIAEVAMVAALCQCLVEYFSRMIDATGSVPTMPDWYVNENKWRASRYGMDAVLIEDAQGTERHVKEILLNMLDRLVPIAEEFGCVQELVLVNKLIEIGAPYERQLAAEEGSLNPLETIVEFMRAEMTAGCPIAPQDFVSTFRGTGTGMTPVRS